MAGVPTHYLRENASEWTPRHVIFLDTETEAERGDNRETLRMRLWAGSSVDRRPKRQGDVPVRSGHGGDRASLARWVDGASRGHQSTWLYAHNLGFDLTVSRLPDFLHRLGWVMSGWSFAGRSVKGSMRKRSKSLTLVDSVSLLPHSLEQVGRWVGRAKLPMPALDAPYGDWLTYCQGDVAVLAEAVLTLMEWWDREQLGHWSRSGPACGWNAMRHMTPPRSLLIRPDPEGVKADRAAVRGGRRDVTRVGSIPGGPFALVDFSNAYLTIVANCLLPRTRLGYYPSIDAVPAEARGRFFGLLADVELDTPVPRYPLRTEAGIFYPTGRFRTQLCSPELAWAQEAGHVRSIWGCWVHDLGYPLETFGRWCLERLSADDKQTPPVVKAMVKQWGRSVPGKFAARQSIARDMGPALWPHWHLERGSCGPDHTPLADVSMAGRRWWYVGEQESDNSYPALLAWVESYVRVALGRMLEALGDGLWVCCDTDGLVLDLTSARSWLRGRRQSPGRIRGAMSVARAVCEAVTPLCAPLVPRVKLLSETLTVAGPQHYAGDSFERAAGRPGKLEPDRDGSLHLWRWPRVGWQMEHGETGGFVRVETAWTHPSQLAHRWVLDDGRAVPVRAHLDATGTPMLSDWDLMIESMGEVKLAAEQSIALRGLA